MDAPTVSVIICAYTMDRWGDLVAAVRSVDAQGLAHEVIVVIDHNAELLERASALWSGHRVVANRSRAGLSGARNTGVGLASGSHVAFLDDDASAHPGWLQGLIAPFDDPRVVAVGGASEPLWSEGVRRDFYASELYWIVGSTYTGMPVSQAEVRNVIGCSMVFRRDVLVEHGGFDLGMGRVGRIPLGCEETELCIRVRQADPDARIVFAPSSRVSHRVTANRVGWAYLWRRCFYEGVSKAVLSRAHGAGDSLASERSYVASVLPRALVRELRSLGRGGATRATGIALSVLGAGLGYLYGRMPMVRIAAWSDEIEVLA